MFTEVKNHLWFMFLCFKYNLLKNVEDRKSFIIQMIFVLLNDCAFIVQWYVFFSFKQNIGGYTFENLISLYALVMCSYGISHLFLENVYMLPELICGGRLDSYIMQPKNILINVACSKADSSAIGDIIFGCILLFTVKINLFLFIIAAVCSAMMLTAFSAIIGSLTFWLKKNEIAYSINFSLTAFAIYPEGLFKGATKLLLYTIIPAALIFYSPIKLVLKFDFIFTLVTLLVTTVFTLLAFLVFNLGLKNYSSNNFSTVRV